jgi:hypothetical protein
VIGHLLGKVTDLAEHLAAANERAETAERECEATQTALNAEFERACQWRTERDEARARLAELGTEWGVCFPSNQIEPCDSETDAREWAAPDGPSGFGLTVVCRHASKWRDAKTADATGAGLSGTETGAGRVEAREDANSSSILPQGLSEAGPCKSCGETLRWMRLELRTRRQALPHEETCHDCGHWLYVHREDIGCASCPCAAAVPPKPLEDEQ